MSQTDSNEVLNHAFIRLYRSLGHYLDNASPVFDLGEDVVLGIIAERKADAKELGQLVQARKGFVETGSYPHTFSDTHFLAVSHLLDLLIDDQNLLIQGLQGDQQFLGPGTEESAFLDKLITTLKTQLHQLEQLRQTSAS